jgi:hypothetical protein
MVKTRNYVADDDQETGFLPGRWLLKEYMQGATVGTQSELATMLPMRR